MNNAQNLRHSERATATEESPEVSTHFVETSGDSSTPFVPHYAQNDVACFIANCSLFLVHCKLQ